MYSLLKCNKAFILSLKTKKDAIGKLRENSNKNLNLDMLLQNAFNNKMKTGKVLKYGEFTADNITNKTNINSGCAPCKSNNAYRVRSNSIPLKNLM